jgi:large subunit ribosomal protein L15
MKLHHLRPAEGAARDPKRKGRGKAAGQGKTAGRGTKGYKARHPKRLGFEGGQTPLQRRIPKLKGFSNPNRVEWAIVNVQRLGVAFDAGSQVTPEALRARGLVRPGRPVKVLGQGPLDRALTVKDHAVSDSARSKIEQAGGTVEIIETVH